MPMKTIYVVQAFELHQKRMVPTVKHEARDLEHAKVRAERFFATGGAAAVLMLVLDTDTGEVDATKVLATYGEVPDNLDELVGG